MRWKTALILAATLALLAAWPTSSKAVTRENFRVSTTGDLVALCSAPNDDPMRVAAIHFCEGFVIGAYQYHEMEQAGPRGTRLFCLPASGLTVQQGVRMFIEWAQKNPQYMSEKPVDSLVRFAVTTFPCRK